MSPCPACGEKVPPGLVYCGAACSQWAEIREPGVRVTLSVPRDGEDMKVVSVELCQVKVGVRRCILASEHDGDCLDALAAANLRIEHLRAGLGSLLAATDGRTVNSAQYQEIRARCAALVEK